MRLYSVDPEQLSLVFGCGDADLTDDLDTWLGHLVGESELPTLRALLHQLVDGAALGEHRPEDLRRAVELLIQHIGDDLDLGPFRGSNLIWIEAVDCALPEMGIHLRSLRESPPPLPVEVDGLGSWSAEQIRRAVKAWPRRRAPSPDPVIEEAIEQVHEWLLDANENGDIIISFDYP